MLIDIKMQGFEIFFIDNVNKLPRIGIAFGNMGLSIKKTPTANII